MFGVLRHVGSNLTKVRPIFTLSHKGSDNPHYWSYSGVLVCILRHDIDQSDSVFKTQCTTFEDDESYIFVWTRACSLLRSNGQKVRASEIPSDVKKSKLIGQHN